ncbi:MAG TPA: restriction endonuclease subunit S [Terriglobia bacterium]|nr:restriction endonuclease subunit S [Terriglobia bacterium]
MSHSWPLVPLRETASPVERSEVPLPGTAYRQLGVRLWGQGAYEREPMDGSETKYSTLSRVEGGDIVVNKIWARNGSVAVVPEALGGAYVSGEFPTFVPAHQKLDPRWFHWFTKTPYCWEQCDEKSRGTSGKNRIRPDQFLEIAIPLPPLDEQRRIVARIEALANKIEEARALRGEASQDAAGFIGSLHLRLAGTRTLRLEQFLELYEDQEPVQVGRSYPQIGVKGFGQGLFARAAVEGSQTTYAAFNRLYEGAVVLSQVKGWEGAIAVCPSTFSGAYVSPEYRTFRCIPSEAIPEYLAGLFATPWFWSKLGDLTRGVGARRERVRPELFLKMEIPMPAVNDQRRVAPAFEKTRALKRLQAETAAELDALLPSILDKAFKGGL